MTNDSTTSDSTTFDIDKFREEMDKRTVKLVPFDMQPHVCPNCGNCPTCGRRDVQQWPGRPLPWEYRPDQYYKRFSTPLWKWQQPDIVMCVG